MSHNVKPWRFVVLVDYPDAGLLRGDIVTATSGRPTRVTRRLPVNPGLLLNLHMQDIVAPIEGFIGTEATIVAALEKEENPACSGSLELRVLR